ncbi:MAG: hypothetical protein UV05_C0025G0014 [candidate division CPR1 bacterium GW2011_GWA2_42_17]|uniref:Uncharacterized protein n=1 Tax=candidate division CPR1 bacterium GW2011_GWA2_42_17 TaxID=1618341 RepID=A0A0G0Z4N1_9BACT|nr:MAG: hypothetical protein UV05_C0025G0014 [candidate division CPR1 bacterium GW2011_GWA2_42_17]
MPALIHFGQISLTGELKIAAMLSYTIMVFPKDANASAQQVESGHGTVRIQVSLKPEENASEDFIVEYNPRIKTLRVWPTDGSWGLDRFSKKVQYLFETCFSERAGWVTTSDIAEKAHCIYCWNDIEQEWLLRLVPERFRSKFEN